MSKATKIIAGLGVVAGLGVAALPMASYAVETVAGEVELSADVNEAIAMTILGNGDNGAAGVDVYSPTGATTIDGHSGGSEYDPTDLETSSSTVSLLPNAANTSTATSAVTVYTNAASGFTLNVRDADDNTALVNSGDSTATIPAGTTITAGTAAWGYQGGTATNFTAITTTDAVVYSQNAPTHNGQTINMTYGVSTASDQKTGTYTDTIVYTATTN